MRAAWSGELNASRQRSFPILVRESGDGIRGQGAVKKSAAERLMLLRNGLRFDYRQL